MSNYEEVDAEINQSNYVAYCRRHGNIIAMRNSFIQTMGGVMPSSLFNPILGQIQGSILFGRSDLQNIAKEGRKIAFHKDRKEDYE